MTSPLRRLSPPLLASRCTSTFDTILIRYMEASCNRLSFVYKMTTRVTIKRVTTRAQRSGGELETAKGRNCQLRVVVTPHRTRTETSGARAQRPVGGNRGAGAGLALGPRRAPARDRGARSCGTGNVSTTALRSLYGRSQRRYGVRRLYNDRLIERV